MILRDRIEAGQKLAQKLMAYRDVQAVVYALPRGGVVVGAQIAGALQKPLDLVIARKIGHPHAPEFGIAAVTENGYLVKNGRVVATVDPGWFEREVERQRNEAKRRRDLYLADRKPIPAEGQVAILVDDGIATGLTVEAAIVELKERRPTKIVLAVPVLPRDTARRLAAEVDELVALTIPEPFLGAISAYYLDFAQTSDEEVVQILREVNRQHG